MSAEFFDTNIFIYSTELGCSILWTEDLASGQQYGSVKVLNPFL
jgi:predicted nucleic acid-binding protein